MRSLNVFCFLFLFLGVWRGNERNKNSAIRKLAKINMICILMGDLEWRQKKQRLENQGNSKKEWRENKKNSFIRTCIKFEMLDTALWMLWQIFSWREMCEYLVFSSDEESHDLVALGSSRSDSALTVIRSLIELTTICSKILILVMRSARFEFRRLRRFWARLLRWERFDEISVRILAQRLKRSSYPLLGTRARRAVSLIEG